MLKKILAVATITTSLSCLAYADDNFEKNYIKLEGAYSVANGKIGSDAEISGAYYEAKGGNSAMFGIGMGTNLGSNFRAGIDLGYRGGFKSKTILEGYGHLTQPIKIYSAMANVNFDMPVNEEVSFYVGAGAGLGRLSFDKLTITRVNKEVYIDNEKYNKNQNNFIWQLGAGASWKLSDEAILGVGYRYIDFGKFSRKSADNNFFAKQKHTVKDKVQVGFGGEGKLKAHEFLVDIRFEL